MLDVNSIMAKTEAKCRGRVCLRKLSWTGYVCKQSCTVKVNRSIQFSVSLLQKANIFFLKHNYFVTENRKTKGQNDL